MAFSVNAARAQRIEARGAKWEFEIDGKTYSLPTEVSRGLARKMRDIEDIDELLALLLGDKQAKLFDAHEVSLQDLTAIIKQYNADTAITAGEGNGSAS